MKDEYIYMMQGVFESYKSKAKHFPNFYRCFFCVFFRLVVGWWEGGLESQNMLFICTYVVNDNSFILVKRALHAISNYETEK